MLDLKLHLRYRSLVDTFVHLSSMYANAFIEIKVLAQEDVLQILKRSAQAASNAVVSKAPVV